MEDLYSLEQENYRFIFLMIQWFGLKNSRNVIDFILFNFYSMHLILRSKKVVLNFLPTNVSIHSITLQTVTAQKYLGHFFLLYSSSKKKKNIAINTLLQFPANDTPSHQITRRTKDPIPFPNSHCSTTARQTVRRHCKSLQKGGARQCWWTVIEASEHLGA